MLLTKILLIVILLLDATRIKKVIPSSDYECSGGTSGSPFTDGEDINSEDDSSGNGINNYSDCSFHHELANLTSNGVIKITNDVMLLSILQLVGLENITITGNDNPTVNCDNSGGLYFENCHNCTVMGIIWEKCGNENFFKPAIELYNSSNVIMQNCSFQHSAMQAIALSKMSGEVIINGCAFLFNNFEGHGRAIYYLSNNKHINAKLQFTITNTNFIRNGKTRHNSIVYIGSSSNTSLEQIHFVNSAFRNNNGTPLYISNQSVVVSGSILFEKNLAKNGGAMFITQHAKLIFYKSDAKFVNNKVLNLGGALDIEKRSIVTFQESEVTMNNNEAVSGGAIFNSNSISTFKGNSTLTASNNLADYVGFGFISTNSDITFAGSSMIKISHYQGRSVVLHIHKHSIVTFEEKCTLTIEHINSPGNIALNFYISLYSVVTFKENCVLTINNDYAGALRVTYNSTVIFEGESVVTINNNKVFDEVFYISTGSAIIFEGNCMVTIDNHHAKGNGGALYIALESDVSFKGNSTVMINNNQAESDGGAIYITNKCNVIFQGNSIVIISNNDAKYNGGALYVELKCNVLFKGNSTVTISNNQAGSDGGALYITNKCNVIFQGNSMITVANNDAKYNGGALYIELKSDVIFKGNSTVIINNNQAGIDGGALYIKNSNVTFKGNSTVAINNNRANCISKTLYSTKFNISYVSFKGNCLGVISNDKVKYNGGALSIRHNSDVTFKGNSIVKIKNNQAKGDGGAFYIKDDCNVMFKQNSTVTISNNQAIYHGGALFTWLNSNIAFTGNTAVTFDNSTATRDGGALHFKGNCNVQFQEDSFVGFYNNSAGGNGGALHGQKNCSVKFNGNSIVIFSNNEAVGDGGALYSISNCHNTFQENSALKFINNRAKNSGGALLSSSNIMFEKNCTISFNHNEASQGGAIFILSNIVFKENSTVKFENNIATFGGAIHISKFDVTFEENTVVKFDNNEAVFNGGALYSEFSNITLKQNSTIFFTDNSAENGGAAFISTSALLLSEYTNVTIINSIARKDGGAIYLNELISAIFKDSSTFTVASNAADNYGGGIYIKITQNTKYFNISDISFSDNKARVAGSLLYIEVSPACNASCLNDRIVGISNEILQHSMISKKVATSPSALQLHYPTKCIDYQSAVCHLYYIDSIMLGQEMIIHACLLDYYNKPAAEVTQFKIIGEVHQNLFVHGSEFASISCNHTVGRISIIGNKPISELPINFSVLFSSYIINSERKFISANLIVGLSPCHPGFQYYSKSQRCECYNNSGIVFCSGSSSTIKRGYWFGHVTGIPTVTFCPNEYCNFTCCKTTNGYYNLSPERVNQCRSQRSGTACGSCKEGHTLSFDSAECISINRCFSWETILVVALTMIYWFAIIIAVFIFKYYRVGIAHLHVFTYYYSLVDVLLQQHTDLSNGLHIMVITMSSIAKLTPQFLGQFCLFKNISGIDQQFMHYAHPLAVLIIFVIINQSAKHFKRLSAFISKGIIHAICFLLLLSYTSVATTS